MSAWKQYKDENKNGGGGIFLRLKDGEKVEGVVSGDPLRRVIHWVDSKPFLCAGDGCKDCATGDKPRKSFAILFFELGEGAWRILDLSPAAFDELADFEDDFADNTILFKRTGSGKKDTRYRARVGGPIDDALRGKMEAEEEPDLQELCLGDMAKCAAETPF